MKTGTRTLSDKPRERGRQWYVYAGGNNSVRAERKGQECRLLARGSMGTVLVEFADGSRMTTSRRAIRRVK